MGEPTVPTWCSNALGRAEPWHPRLELSASVAISAEENTEGGEAAKPPSDAMITATMIVSLIFLIGLFFVLPTLLASLGRSRARHRSCVRR